MTEKNCVLCGCKDHKLLGYNRHTAKQCNCYSADE